MASTTTNYGWTVPTSSDLVKNGATAISTVGQSVDTFLFRPFTKNAIINGACEIAQRGTSAVTLTAASFLYPVDRMFAGRSSGTTGATAQQISSISLTGFSNAVRIQRTAGNTSTNDLYIGQSMESLNSIPFAGQTVTLSFYARAGANYSSSGSTLAVRLYSGTGTDQAGLGSAFTGTATPISASQVITTSWVRYSFTAAISSSATQLQFLAFYTPVGTAGAADSVDITGIQLEVGSQVSPFTRAMGTIQGELAACQRYAIPLFRQSGIDCAIVVSRNATTGGEVYYQLPVQMRGVPSATLISGSYGRCVFYDTSFGLTTSNVTAIAIGDGGNYAAINILLTHGSVAGTYVTASWDSATNGGFIMLSAEL